MSQFLDSVRVYDVSFEWPNASKAVNQGVSKDGTTLHITKDSSDSSGGFETVPICAIVFTFIYLIIKAIMAPFTQRAKYARAMPQGGGGLTQEEVAVLQKLQRTLSQMESRVESLETILIEQARTEKKYGSKL